MSCQVLKIFRDEDSTTSLSNLFPCLVTLTLKKKMFSAVRIEYVYSLVFLSASGTVPALSDSLCRRHTQFSVPYCLYIFITTNCSAGIIYNFVELCSICVGCLTNIIIILVLLKIKQMLLIILIDFTGQPFITQEPDHQPLYAQRSTDAIYTIEKTYWVSEKIKSRR